MIGVYNISMFSCIKVIDISGDYAVTQYCYGDKACRVTKNKIKYNKNSEPYFIKNGMKILFNEVLAV